MEDREAEKREENIAERLHILETAGLQRERQMDVILSAIPGGLKSSLDDAVYTYAYVSPEAAALFGYTVEEFLEMSGGTAVGACYPADRATAVAKAQECFQNGGETYTVKYRIPCKDGTLKWVLDSGRKSCGTDGSVLIYSLYLDITHEEASAHEILQQKRLLQNIYDTVPCGIIRFAREKHVYTLLSINRASQELLGYQEGEDGLSDWKNGIIGQVVEEDRPTLRQANEQLQTPGDRVEVAYRIRRADGGVRWLSGMNTLLSSQNGREIIQRTIFDVTDRHLLQEQLEREREMYRLAMESSSDIMYEYREKEDTFVCYEPQAGKSGILRREIRNYRTELQSGRIVHPDDVPAAMEIICQGRSIIFDCRIIPPDGYDYRWYRVTGKMMEAGQERRIVGTMRDIQAEKSARMANEMTLQIHQLAFQALSSVYISIYYIDLSTDWYYGVRIPDTSQLVIPRTGHYQRELSIYFAAHADREDLPRLMPCSDPAYLREKLGSVGQHIEVEFCHHGRSGEKIWLRYEVQLMSTENGTAKNVVSSFRDITESRRQEMKRRQEEEQATRALEDAYTTANRANQAKSDFLSKMSHDMRTPMNAIMGMTSIALENLSDPARLQDCLEKIQLSSRHLLNLINEVLDMSKIESGKTDLNETTMDLREVVEETACLIRPDAEQKGQKFQVETVDLEHVSVLGDGVRIRQILLNLTSNAVKYTPTGGTVRLSLREGAYFSASTSRYIFTVEDNGIGMSTAFQKKLFRPFERAEDSRVSRIQGTGLGMAITYNLVKMMNGTIEVESQLDVGTRVTVVLNLRIAQPMIASEEALSQSENPSTEPIQFRNGSRVLLVEDNELNREIARYMLEEAGLVVEEAGDGQEAVDKFAASPVEYYQIILMDIQMPLMDGYEATQQIRALARPDARGIPIVALTANAFAEDVGRAREMGMNDHVAKPLDAARLLETLKRHMRS